MTTLDGLEDISDLTICIIGLVITIMNFDSG